MPENVVPASPIALPSFNLNIGVPAVKSADDTEVVDPRTVKFPSICKLLPMWPEVTTLNESIVCACLLSKITPVEAFELTHQPKHIG